MSEMGGLNVEAPSASVEEIQIALSAAGLKESVLQNFMPADDGFVVSALKLPEIGLESVIVEYRPKHSYAPLGPAIDKAVWERSIAVEAAMLARYHEILAAAGWQVTNIKRTPNGRQAWLVVR